jgi:hypothetical protein
LEVYLNRLDGWDDAIISMFLSKRTLTRELEMDIRKAVYESTSHNPEYGPIGALLGDGANNKVGNWIDKFIKWGQKHITMGRFLDFSFTVYNLHRAGQDDLDSHAKRMENRIIRSSTRLADFSAGEMSDYYKGKIIPTDAALAVMGITTPDEIEVNGKTYVRGVNGYILKGMENNKDVKRGLYMLSIPSTFIFKINLTEFAHVYKERWEGGTANPEVKQAVMWMADQLYEASAYRITHDLLMNIKN